MTDATQGVTMARTHVCRRSQTDLQRPSGHRCTHRIMTGILLPAGSDGFWVMGAER